MPIRKSKFNQKPRRKEKFIKNFENIEVTQHFDATKNFELSLFPKR